MLNIISLSYYYYIKYHYQFCENTDSSFLSNNLDINECYIKSCLVYKYLYEIYFRKSVTLNEIMTDGYH